MNSRTLLELTSAPDYASRVAEVVQKIPAAVHQFDALGLLAEAIRRIGADTAAFATFARDDGSHESFRFLLACDPVWCHEYQEHTWFASDPWLLYALNHSEPVRTSEIPVATKHQQLVVDLAAKFGFRSAVVVPAPSSGGLSRIGVLCLGSPTAGYFDGEGFLPLKIAARSLAMELHEWWIDKLKRELIDNADLTEEDLVLLRKARLGMGTKAIAQELGMTTASIDSRFQRMIHKLGVANRTAAATMAAENGLI